MRRLLFSVILLTCTAAACQPADVPLPTTASATTASPTVPELPCPVPVAAAPEPTPGGSPESWLTYFNRGGDLEALDRLSLERRVEPLGAPAAMSLDLTGDGVLDLLVAVPLPGDSNPPAAAQPAGRLDVLVCVGSRYAAAWSATSNADSGVPLPRLIADVDSDGRQDVLLARAICGAHTCFGDFAVLTWDGTALADRWQGSSADLPFPEAQLIQAAGGGPAIQVTGTGYGSVGAGPYRPVCKTWRWDETGKTMRLDSEVSLPSPYRIHMLYDALTAEATGRHDGAAEMYQRVIADDSLQDWQDPVPERAALGAFASFRRVRLFAMQADDGRALAELESLRSMERKQEEARPFAAMARTFWESFEREHDAAAACEAARQAVTASDAGPDAVLRLLDFGYANPTLTLEALCPSEDA